MHAHAVFQQEVGEILGHAFRERRDEDTFVLVDSFFNLRTKIIDLPSHGFDDDFGIHEPGGANDLLDVAVRAF